MPLTNIHIWQFIWKQRRRHSIQVHCAIEWRTKRNDNKRSVPVNFWFVNNNEQRTSLFSSTSFTANNLYRGIGKVGQSKIHNKHYYNIKDTGMHFMEIEMSKCERLTNCEKKKVHSNDGQKTTRKKICTNKYLDKRWGNRQTLAVTTYYSTFRCWCSFLLLGLRVQKRSEKWEKKRASQNKCTQ